MRTYREIEAKWDNDVSDYKFGMAMRLGPPEPPHTGTAPRARNQYEDTTDTPENNLEWCARCRTDFRSIELDYEGLCADCSEETAYEREQEMWMNREDYS